MTEVNIISIPINDPSINNLTLGRILQSEVKRILGRNSLWIYDDGSKVAPNKFGHDYEMLQQGRFDVIGSNYRRVDAYDPDRECVVSMKCINLNAPSYQPVSGLPSILKTYIKGLLHEKRKGKKYLSDESPQEVTNPMINKIAKKPKILTKKLGGPIVTLTQTPQDVASAFCLSVAIPDGFISQLDIQKISTSINEITNAVDFQFRFEMEIIEVF